MPLQAWSAAAKSGGVRADYFGATANTVEALTQAVVLIANLVGKAAAEFLEETVGISVFPWSNQRNRRAEGRPSWRGRHPGHRE